MGWQNIKDWTETPSGIGVANDHEADMIHLGNLCVNNPESTGKSLYNLKLH